MRYKTVTFVLFSALICVFAYIAHQNLLLRLSYKKQRAEKVLERLAKEQNSLEQQWSLLQRHDRVKERAVKELGMVPVKIEQIERL